MTDSIRTSGKKNESKRNEKKRNETVLTVIV
jgi:hypothetical protein